MILDITVILIFVVSTLLGKRHGFLESIIRLGSLVVALVAGVMFTENVNGVLCSLGLDSRLMESLSERAEAGEIDPTELIPGDIGDTITNLTNGLLRTTVLHFTNLIISCASFAIIIGGVALVAWFLRRKLHKDRMRKGVIGTVDESVGLLIGAVRGVILVCLFLAFLLPLAGIFAPDQLNSLNEMLNNSYIAGPLYDINPILSFMKNLNL